MFSVGANSDILEFKSESGIDDDGHSRLRCHLLGNGCVEVNVSLRRADRDDEAVAGRQAVAFLGRARAPPALGGVDGDEATVGQFGCCASPDVFMQRAAMPLSIAKNPVRVLGIGRVAIVFAFGGGVDAGHEVVGRRVQRTLNIKAQSVRWIVELRRRAAC